MLRAQEGQAPPRTLPEAALQALAQYPSLVAAGARARAAESVADRSAAARWPSVQLSATATRFQEPMLVTPLHGFDLQQPPAFDETLLYGNVNARYTVWDGGERGARIEQARERSAAAAAAVTATEADVLWEVARQYLRVLATAEAVQAQDQRLVSLGEELRRVRRLVEEGKAPQLDLVRAEAAVAAAQAERVRTRTQQELAARELARLTGASGEIEPGTLALVRLPERAVPARVELVELALTASPELAAAERQRGAAAAEVKVARSAFLPDVHLFGNYDGRGSTDRDIQGEWNVGAGISYPLFQGGARRNELQRARAEREVADAELALARLRVQQRLDGALAALAEAEARAQSLGTAVAQFAAVVNGERLALEAGSGTQADYLAAEAELVGARAQLAEAGMNRILAWTDLARITGQLSLRWLRDTLGDGQ